MSNELISYMKQFSDGDKICKRFLRIAVDDSFAWIVEKDDRLDVCRVMLVREPTEDEKFQPYTLEKWVSGWFDINFVKENLIGSYKHLADFDLFAEYFGN